jgi:HAD superfamily hydrolase (TIGR01509 family)
LSVVPAIAATAETTPLPAAVLWDMDGTLVDTEPYWIAAEISLAERDGGTWTHEDGLTLIGNPLPFSARQLRERAGVVGTDEEIVDDLLALVIAQVRAHGVPWRPGALDLLRGLRDAGVRCALVTMSYASLARAILEAAPEGAFHEVVTGDMVERGKPHPEPYLTAAARLGVDPRDCVAFEDSTTGLASAEESGAHVVGVQLLLPIPPAPGRSRLGRLDQITVDDLRRIRAGDVLDRL